VLDTSIASVALPHIAGSVSASTDEATWVLTSYLVANAVVLPASGWFSPRMGRKRFLLLCIMIFTAASFACGAALSLGMILMARAVQGAGGGALQPLSQAILLESFPPHKRGLAMAMFGLGVVVAPIVGPSWAAGSPINTRGAGRSTSTFPWASWRSSSFRVLWRTRLISKTRVSAASTGSAWGCWRCGWAHCKSSWIRGRESDRFGAVWIRWTAGILLVALAVFLYRELTIHHPLVNLRIFSSRNFAIGCLLIGLFGAVIYGVITLLPLFYQTLMGYTAGLGASR
jgi:DHA2 family multidrug resistance protein